MKMLNIKFYYNSEQIKTGSKYATQILCAKKVLIPIRELHRQIPASIL